MFEYWFHGIDATEEVYAGATNDFLELVCRIADYYGDTNPAGLFIDDLVNKYESELAYLRVIDWKFTWQDNDRKIVVHYSPIN